MLAEMTHMLYEIRGFLIGHEEAGSDIPAEWFAAIDGAIDISAKAEELHDSVRLAAMDVDTCREE